MKASTALLAGSSIARISDAAHLFYSALTVDENGVAIAEGYVFEDRSGSGRKDSSNPGIPNVCVSNGIDVVKTDQSGKWRLPVTQDCILFVIKPSGYSVPLDKNNLPQYFYAHKPNGAPSYKYKGISPTGPLPKSIDFGLTRQAESSKFNMVLFGDPQPRNQREVDYMSHDVIEQVVRDANEVDAKFGLSLGDIMFDNLSIYESLNQSIGQVGIPWYSVVGNHDLNFDSPTHKSSTETFQSAFGPTYYAFNFGQVHFIVLNDVLWHGVDAAGKPMGFHGEISSEQLEFVKNDLAQVPKDKLIFVAMHIPPADVKNIAALWKLIENRPNTFSVSAHTHVQEHYFLTEKDGWNGEKPHHHLNHATVCGSWWGGNPDERGIPHATMTDGVPNGYSIIEFDGTKYRVDFRPASKLREEQMSIFLPEVVAKSQTEKTEILVNVFAGSEKSIVEMQVNNSGDWIALKQIVREDPYYVKLKEMEVGTTPPKGYYKLQPPTKSRHIWTGTLPPRLPVGTNRVRVRTRDMFGNTFVSEQFIRVTLI